MGRGPLLPPAPDRTGNGGAIRLAAVTTGYRNGRPVLNKVSFAVAPGEIAAIVGPNGSGKTTLFRLLLGLLRPWEGVATVGDLDPGVYRRQVGVAFLPDSVAAPPGWSALALLRQGVRLAGLSGPKRDTELHRAMERTGLSSEDLSGAMEHLSKGMARRVVEAMVLAGAPSPVLLDEPLTGLDAASRVRLRRGILRCAESGATVLMASHDLDEVQRIATRVVLLRDGVVEEVLEGRRRVEGSALERMVLGEKDHSTPAGLEEAP